MVVLALLQDLLQTVFSDVSFTPVSLGSDCKSLELTNCWMIRDVTSEKSTIGAKEELLSGELRNPF